MVLKFKSIYVTFYDNKSGKRVRWMSKKKTKTSFCGVSDKSVKTVKISLTVQVHLIQFVLAIIDKF